MMKNLRLAVVMVVPLAILVGIPAQAQVTLVPYDNFEAKLLDPGKWFGDEDFGAGGVNLESKRQIKADPTYGRGLDLVNRAYGDTTSNDGTSFGATRLVFPNGSNITTIQAKVQVKRYQVQGCDDNTATTDARTRLGGSFFNTDTPTPGSSLNDVYAFIMVRRKSGSTAPSNVLEVVGYAVHCTDDDCVSGDLIGAGSLGTLLVGQRVKLRITWDQANHQFVFQKGKGAEVLIPYDPIDFPETSLPGAPFGGFKRLDVCHNVANCMTQPRPVAFMETFFDDIFVNEQP